MGGLSDRLPRETPGMDVADLTRKQQRTDDLRRLGEVVADLPKTHPDRRGIVRAIEILRSLELRDTTR